MIFIYHQIYKIILLLNCLIKVLLNKIKFIYKVIQINHQQYRHHIKKQ